METLAVLVYTDDGAHQRNLCGLLTGGAGSCFRVLAAPTLTDACDLLGSVRVDALLADLDLPDPAALARLRTLRRAAPNLPLVVIAPGEENGQQALAEGTQEYLAGEDLAGPLLAKTLRFACERAALRSSEEQLRRLNAELEQRVAERTADLENANRELESFSYSVSHDLRAPLRAIDGFALILKEESAERLDEPARAHLERILAAACRMGGLIDDLLQLSRVMRLEFNPVPVDLSALAATIVADLRREYPQRSVEVAIKPGLTAVGDRNMLAIALGNLIDNAWKYTGKTAAARIEFDAREEGGRPAFVLSDNGAGFDMTYAERLFTPFQRLHRDQEFPGNGIGLATVARIVHRHHGEIRAEGRPNAGATFSFTLGANGVAPGGEKA